MVRPIPRWVMERYAKVYRKHDEKPITFEDIEKILKADSKRMISVFLNELKDAGWVEVALHPEDTRKRQYTLKDPKTVIGEIARQ